MPPTQITVTRRRAACPATPATDAHPPLLQPVHELAPLTLCSVIGTTASRLWNEYIARYHYLGYTRPISTSHTWCMQSLTPNFLAALRYDGLQLATLRALGEYQGKQHLYAVQSPEALADLRQIAVVESTESSDRLEGVVVTPGRLKSLVIKNAVPKSRSEQEVAGYRDALALIHEAAADMPFSEGVVLQLHTMLNRYMPQPGGRWKAANNDIIERHPDGGTRLRFQPVAAHLTTIAMGELTGRYAIPSLAETDACRAC